MTAAVRALLVVPLALAVLATAGCSDGCGDEVRGDVVEVQLARSVAGPDREVRVVVCQEGRCESTRAPATQRVVEVYVSELGIDVEREGEVRVEVVDAEGRLVASTSVPFDFDSTREGAGCPEVREQEVALTAS